MNTRVLRVAYLAAAATTTIAAAAGRRRTHVASKWLLMPVLAADVLLDQQTAPGRRGALAAALAGAWVGDVVLALPTDDARLERRRLRQGATAFAAQQSVYLTLLTRDGARPRLATAAPLVLGLLGAAAVDSSDGSAPDPVLVGYGVLLGAMGCLAAGDGDRRIRWGGRLFVASDIAIMVRSALLRSDRAERAGQAFILATYTAAQLLLTDGLRRVTTPTAPA